MKRKILLAMLSVALLPLCLRAQGDCTVTLPWSENFDSYTVTGGATQPDCWVRVAPFQTSGSTAIYPNLTTAYGHGTVLNFLGQGNLNIITGSSSGSLRIATPLIEAPLNQMEISFEVYKSGLTLYLATDPNDESTYIFVGSYDPGYLWTTYEVRTDIITNVTEQGYLVFSGNYGSSGYSTAYLDNLEVVSLNSCQRPEEVEVDGVTPNTASIYWTPVQDAGNYRVSYGTVNDIAQAEFEEVAGTSVALEGLEAATHYYVWVQTLCDDNTMSDPRTAEFNTQGNCYPIVDLRMVGVSSNAAAFQWDFDNQGFAATEVVTILHDLTDGEEVESVSMGTNYHFFSDLDNTHDYVASFRTVCSGDTAEAVSMPIVFRNCGESELTEVANNRSQQFPLTAFYNYSVSQMMYPASVLYDMDTLYGLALRRDTTGASQNVTRTLSIWLANSSSEALTSTVSTNGMTQVANNVQYVLKGQEWDTLMFTTPFVYTAGSNLMVTLDDNSGDHLYLSQCPYWRYHDAEWNMYYKSSDDNNIDPATAISSASSTMMLPDVRFVGPCHGDGSCEAPVSAFGYIDSNEAELDWIGGEGSEWTVQYRPLGTIEWTTAGTATVPPYAITGLNPGTAYEARIGTVCNGAETRYGRPVPFTTACAPMPVPFHFTQEEMIAAAENGFTPCWTFSNNVKRGRLSDSHRGYLRNVGNGQWIMLPDINVPVQGVRLQTWVESSDAASIKVGVAGMTDCSDVVWVDTVQIPASNPNLSHHDYTVYLDRYEGTGRHIVLSPIVNNAYHYVYFFDFHIEPIEGCRPVVGLTLDEAEANSMTFSWTPVGEVSQWTVFVDGEQVGLVNTPSFTATELEPYTDYEVTVRTFCGDGDTSDATTAVFRTGCTGESCTLTINGHSATGDGWNGGYLTIAAGDEVIGTMKMLNGSAMSKSLMVCADMTLTFNWLSGNADAVCSFDIIDGSGLTVYHAASAEELGEAFYITDSICATHGSGPIDPPDPPDTTGIGGVYGDAAIALYPNPTTGKVTLSVGQPSTFSIVDMTGRTVVPATPVNTEYTIEALPAGTYFVRIVGERTTAVRKLIVR